MILGYTWLKHHNPDINWETGQVKMTRCPWTCRVLQGKFFLEQSIDTLDQNSLRTIHAIKKEQERSEVQKSNLRPKDLVPKAYHKYLKVFSKKESECMPVRKPWDHAINMKDTFIPKKGRPIPLSLQEQKEVSNFIDNPTKKGYIRPSKSPQTSPYSLSLRKMERSEWYRTTAISTNTQSGTTICSPLSDSYLRNCKELSCSPRWISDGDSTMLESKKATNEKPPLPVTEAPLNP